MLIQDDIILISIRKAEFQLLIREAVKSELLKKNEKKLLTGKELCKYLDISLSSLNNYKASGKLPYRRLGKKIFFDLDEVIEAMEESGYNKLKNLKL